MTVYYYFIDYNPIEINKNVLCWELSFRIRPPIFRCFDCKDWTGNFHSENLHNFLVRKSDYFKRDNIRL